MSPGDSASPITGRHGAGPQRRTLRLGTRRSQLARAQSGLVATAITELTGYPVDLVEIVTLGDVSAEPITTLGSTGVFVTALRDALLRGEVDLVVHSFKDLPVSSLPGVRLAAIPARQDPRDALVDRLGRRLVDLPPGTRVGTGSARRAAELRRLGLPVTVVPIRGNVDTRLRQVETGEVDAVILAVAGLIRLGRQDVITEIIDPKLILPAPAQGALAVECRAADDALAAHLAALDDLPTTVAVEAERAFLAGLAAGCSAPVGAHATLVEQPGEETLNLEVLFAHATGEAIRLSGRAPAAKGAWLGACLAETILATRSQRR